MPKVTVTEGIRYGFSLLGYVIGVAVFGFLLMVLGIVSIDGNSPALGALFLLIGSVVSYAGAAGLFYKIIADGVAKGNDMSGGTTAQKTSGSTTARKTSGSTTARKTSDGTTARKTAGSTDTQTAQKVSDDERSE